MAYENDSYDQGATSTGGMVRDAAWSMGTFSYSQAALGMLSSKRGMRGYYTAPWTGRISKFARSKGARSVFGSAGITLGGTASQYAARNAATSVFERAGVWGVRGAVRSATTQFGANAAKAAAGRYLVGSAAKFVGGPLMWSLFAVDVVKGVGGLWGAAVAQANKYKGLELGGYFPDSQGAMTSRQRAVQAITSSQLQARSAIGNEAMMFHRGAGG